MADTWAAAPIPPKKRLGLLGWVCVVLRAVPLVVLVFGGLLVLLVSRVFERPVFGTARPVTPYITQFVCRNAFRIMGMGFEVIGTPMSGAGAVVANHASWLDIFALNARKRIYFVSKSEVAGWPGIGWLARATGTVFIRRSRSDIATQLEVFKSRLSVGHKLLFFPEGTSTDGLRVLPFKPSLFASFFDPALKDQLNLQPVTVAYHAPRGRDSNFYGWWGDMEFADHLLATLASPRQGKVVVVYHSPVRVADYPDRKALARAMEKQVRDGLTAHGVVE